jgi:hypothetical protein
VHYNKKYKTQVLGAIGVRLRLITTARGACVCDSGIHNTKKPSTMCYETVDGGGKSWGDTGYCRVSFRCLDEWIARVLLSYLVGEVEVERAQCRREE